LNKNVLRVTGLGDIDGCNFDIHESRMNHLKNLAGDWLGKEYIYKCAANEWAGMRPLSPDDLPILG